MKYYLILLLLIVSCSCITIERPIVVEPTKPHECGCIDGNDGNITRYDGTETTNTIPKRTIPVGAWRCSICDELFEIREGSTFSTCAVHHTDGHCHYNDTLIETDVTCRPGDECDIISTDTSTDTITWDDNMFWWGTNDITDSFTYTDEFLTGLPLADLDHLMIGGCFGPHHALRTPPCCSPDHPTDETCDEDCK